MVYPTFGNIFLIVIRFPFKITDVVISVVFKVERASLFFEFTNGAVLEEVDVELRKSDSDTLDSGTKTG